MAIIVIRIKKMLQIAVTIAVTIMRIKNMHIKTMQAIKTVDN